MAEGAGDRGLTVAKALHLIGSGALDVNRSTLVIVDEAHRMSASDESHKSMRYKLGELLRDSSDHMLLLTATPHKGDPQNFSLFLQLLDADAYADVKSIREAMNRRRAPFYLRRTKEAMDSSSASWREGRTRSSPMRSLPGQEKRPLASTGSSRVGTVSSMPSGNGCSRPRCKT